MLNIHGAFIWCNLLIVCYFPTGNKFNLNTFEPQELQKARYNWLEWEWGKGDVTRAKLGPFLSRWTLLALIICYYSFQVVKVNAGCWCKRVTLKGQTKNKNKNEEKVTLFSRVKKIHCTSIMCHRMVWLFIYHHKSHYDAIIHVQCLCSLFFVISLYLARDDIPIIPKFYSLNYVQENHTHNLHDRSAPVSPDIID